MIEPEKVPGTPQAAEAEATAPRAVDMVERKLVVKQKNKGLWCKLGQDFPGVQIRIRPWSTWFVQRAMTAYERTLRPPKFRPGQDELSPEARLELNRYTATLAVQGLDGEDGQPAAFDFGGGNVVTFTARTDPERVRQFVAEHFLPPVDTDDPETAYEIDQGFLELLMDKEKKLDNVPFEQIAKMGEDFVLGADDQVSYSD